MDGTVDGTASITTISSTTQNGCSTSQDPSVIRRRSVVTQERASTILLSHTEQPSSNQKRVVNEFTANKLRYDELGLCGREKEVSTLKECLGRVTTFNENNRQQPANELVLISGHSGTGKSMLARSLIDDVKKLGGLFVTGKYDLYLRDEPYSGIVDAIDNLCGD